MNHIYRLLWNRRLAMFVPVSENGPGVQQSSGRTRRRQQMRTAMMMVLAAGAVDLADANPVGGQVSAGAASISQHGNVTTVSQASQNVSLNWQSFNLAPNQSVNYIQPNAQSIAVNRILGNQGSQILGHINANGQVWLINPNGILFGPGAQVNVGGLVASTLSVADNQLGAAQRQFAGNGSGSVINQGSLNAAPGGYVALLGPQVSNTGTITAPGGMVALGAGTAQTLTFADNTLLALQIDQSTLNNLAANSGLIQADGGSVILSAGAKDAVLASVVNNTGIIEARTAADVSGKITLLGGMEAGTVNLGGTLDASAPQGGNGGSIETSAAHVEMAPDVNVSTAAPQGQVGSWLIDPQDYTIATSGGDITGAQLGTLLRSNNITIVSDQGATAGNGDINVDAPVTWSTINTLTLNAERNVNFNTGGSITTISGSLTVRADLGGTGVGTINMNGGSIYVSSGGSILFYYDPAVFGTPTTFSNVRIVGSGSATYYMLVDTAAELQNISVNPAGNYALGTNLDASTIANFTPIATFSGRFNGLNDTVSNLTESYPGATSYVGLFSQLSSTALVNNLTLANVNINGGTRVGGLVGYDNGATLTNLNVSGVVTGNGGYIGGLIGYADNSSKISYANSSAAVSESASGTVGYVGGLIGYALGSATISDASSTGSVTQAASMPNTGGLVGYNNATISNSFSTAAVSSTSNGTSTGGLVGDNNATITTSYATGTVNVSTGGGAGGLIGSQTGGTVSNSYATGNVTGAGNYVGGFIGQASGGSVSNTDASGNVNNTGVLGTGGFIGWNDGITINNSYATGNTTSNSNYTGGFAGEYSGGSGTDLYATGNVTTTASFVGGFVGGIITGGTLTNVYASGNVTKSGGTNGATGGFVGLMSSGSITDGYASGAITVPVGAVNVGGFAGTNSGTITHSFWDTTVSGYSTSAGTGAVGMNTANMQTQANYTSATTANGNVNPGWDFTNTWQMGTGAYLYPVFKVAMGPTSTPGVIAAPAAPLSYYPLTVTNLTAQNKVYDGTLIATSTASLGGVLPGNTVNLVLSSSQFSQKDVGTGLTVTLNGASINGASASSYQLVPAAGMTTTANITPLPITVTATAANKVYDATVNDTAILSSTGILNGDSVSFSDTSVTFSDKNVGTNKTVTVSGISDSGANAADYTVNTTATTTANITPLAITVTATGVDKVYDATVNDAAILSSSGVLSGDSVSFTDTAATFSDKNVGTNKTVTVSGISDSGTDAGNYVLNNTAATTTANITPLAITVAATAANKVYDGTVNDTATVSSTGVLSGDNVSFTDTTATFSDKNVGNNKTVTVSGITDSGTDASNYVLNNSSATTTANITPLAITVAATGVDKVYDATVNDAATLSSTGVLNGDSVSFTDASATFADKNVGTNKPVTVTGISASGTDAGNYTFNTTATTTADITPLAITVMATGVNQVYNASPNATVILSSNGVLSGDSLTFSDTSATFANKNVGLNKTITVTGISASGPDAADYVLNNTSATTTANITPAVLNYVAAPVQLLSGTGVRNLSGTVSGLLSGDTLANSTSGSLTWVVSNAASTSRPGQYQVAGAGLSSENYVFVEAPGNQEALIVVPSAAGLSLPPATLLPSTGAGFGSNGISGSSLASAMEPVDPALGNAADQQDLAQATNHTSLHIVNGGVRGPVDDTLPSQ